MLTLQINAPADWELKLGLLRLDVLLENFNCLRVRQSLERRLDHLFKSLEKLDMLHIVRLLLFALCFFFDVHYFKFLEELHVCKVVFEHVFEAELEVVFCTVHVIVQGGERDLRFDHPKLAQMARGVRVLGSECWTKGVAIRETSCIRLHVQLSTDTKECWFSKHVLGVIKFLLFQWDIRIVKLIVIGISCLYFFLLLFVFLVLLSFVSLGCSLFFFLFLLSHCC